MRSSRLLAFITGLVAGLATGQVLADAIITDFDRGVTAFVYTNPISGVSNTSLSTGSYAALESVVGPLDETAVAGQSSIIDVLVFQGAGSVELDSLDSPLILDPAGAAASSDYVVHFDLDVTHAYSLTGSLFVSEFRGGGTIVSFQLADFDTFNLGFSATTSGVTGSGVTVEFTESGLLEPGSYLLALQALALGLEETPYYAAGSWDFNLTLREVAQVPEPGTLALLGLGMLGLGFARRRK